VGSAKRRTGEVDHPGARPMGRRAGAAEAGTGARTRGLHQGRHRAVRGRCRGQHRGATRTTWSGWAVMIVGGHGSVAQWCGMVRETKVSSWVRVGAREWIRFSLPMRVELRRHRLKLIYEGRVGLL
jgi:hypothetical protein